MTPELGIGKRILEATGIEARRQKARELNLAFDQVNQRFDLQEELVAINNEQVLGKGELEVRRCSEGGIFINRPEISLTWQSRKSSSCWQHEVTIGVEGRLVSVSGGGINWGEEFFVVVPNEDSDQAKAEFTAELRRKLAFAFENSRCENYL